MIALTARIIPGGGSLFTPICSFVTLNMFLHFYRYSFFKVTQIPRSREDKMEPECHSLIRTLCCEYLVLVYVFHNKLCLSVRELCLSWLLL